MGDKIELNPCPHCGSDAELSARGVACSRCGASMEYSLDPGRVLAIEAWNARATLQSKPVEGGEALREIEKWSVVGKMTEQGMREALTYINTIANNALRTQPQAPVEQASEPWQLLAEIQIVAALNDGGLPGQTMRKLKAALEAYPNYKEQVVEVPSVEELAKSHWESHSGLENSWDEQGDIVKREWIRLATPWHRALLQSKGRQS